MSPVDSRETRAEIEGPGSWSDDEEALRARKRAALERLDRLANLLDAKWRIPGTEIRFGLDPVISLVPIAGDVAGGLMAAYVVHQAARHGAPRRLIMHMMMNVALDVGVGAVPILGTIFDVVFKPSKLNVAMLRDYLSAAGEIDRDDSERR